MSQVFKITNSQNRIKEHQWNFKCISGVGGPSVYVLLLLVNEYRTTLSLWQGRTELGGKVRLYAGSIIYMLKTPNQTKRAESGRQTRGTLPGKPQPCGDTQFKKNGLS